MKKTIAFAAVAVILASCQTSLTPTERPVDEPMEIHLSMGLTTKVTDTAFEDGDKVGIYVVHQTDVLQTTGNHYDNIEHTFNGGWTGAETMYWMDKSTPADFYCYYPYASVTDVNAHAFTVAADQSDIQSLKDSDFAWGKAEKIAPTTQVVDLMTNHIMSSIKVYLQVGDGFTADSFAETDIKVNLRNVKNNALVNLADGSVTAQGSEVQMTPYKDNGYYRAVVVPQTVADGAELVVVTVNGTEYALKKGFTFVSGKRHKFTVTVNKTGNGVNVGIGSWEEDDEDNGGSAE